MRPRGKLHLLLLIIEIGAVCVGEAKPKEASESDNKPAKPKPEPTPAPTTTTPAPTTKLTDPPMPTEARRERADTDLDDDDDDREMAIPLCTRFTGTFTPTTVTTPAGAQQPAAQPNKENKALAPGAAPAAPGTIHQQLADYEDEILSVMAALRGNKMQGAVAPGSSRGEMQGNRRPKSGAGRFWAGAPEGRMRRPYEQSSHTRKWAQQPEAGAPRLGYRRGPGRGRMRGRRPGMRRGRGEELPDGPGPRGGRMMRRIAGRLRRLPAAAAAGVSGPAGEDPVGGPIEL